MAQQCSEGNNGSATTAIFQSKILCDGRIRNLRVDNEKFLVENIDSSSSSDEDQRRRSDSSRRGSHGRMSVPICEILSVKFHTDEDPKKCGGCSSCCSCPSTARKRRKDRRHLSPKDIPLLTRKSKLYSDGGDYEMAEKTFERETDAVVVYYIRRRGKNLWRLGQIICRFNARPIDDSNTGGDRETAASSVAREFVVHIRSRISGCNRPKKLVVFINPYGGKKKAVELYADSAAPIFQLCGITTTIVVTQRANHARDFVLEEDLSSCDGIVITGGDGLFNEVLNGLVSRKNSNLDINDRKTELTRPSIAIGLIAAGSTNALAHTVHGTDDILTSALHIALGDRRGIDVCGVYIGDRLMRFACTAVSYGFLGDLLKDSERLRPFGPCRYTIAGVKVWLKNSHYGGVVRYKTQSGIKNDGNADAMQLKPCKSACDLCSESNLVNGDLSALKRHESSLSALSETEPDVTWSITDDFAHVLGLVTPCKCEIAPDGISPNCHLGDGYMHLVVVSRIGRMRNLAVIGKIMSKNTDHTQEHKFRLFVVKEFSFTPKSSMKPSFTQSSSDVTRLADQKKTELGNDSNISTPAKAARDGSMGSWNMDGEVVAQPEGTIYFRVHRQLITLFARGPEETS